MVDEKHAKFRASEAEVLSATNFDDRTLSFECATSTYDMGFDEKYKFEKPDQPFH